MENFNYLFVPINFILKRFNYLLLFRERFYFNEKTFKKVDEGYALELLKIEKIDDKFFRIIKKTILWKKVNHKLL
jgi:hypothetical protein